ncbi:MAG TPA: M48 family metallopeptidase [Gemmatimonadales bacterium]|nr:M48 family metallopeptidase [Gemmatimonadales bacterium]
MTDPTSLPTTRPRRALPAIAPVTWEHPSDRAALQTLRAIPGFDQVVRKIVGTFGERGIRLLFQANAVRVGPTQFPVLHALITEASVTMDWPEAPEVYVTQTPLVNAGAVGVDRPFIILNSGAVGLLETDELRVLLGHELGHVMSGHALYRTVLILLLELGFQNLPFLAGIALLPIKLALLEWYRKSELSADRAGLLASQDPAASMQVFLKLAGGGAAKEMDLQAFMRQAAEYEERGGALDTIYKILNTLGATHPFNTLRAAELKRWIDAGTYDKVIAGDYIRRGSEQDRPLHQEFGEAAAHYASEARKTVDDVADAARRAARAFTDAFKGATKQ